MASPPRSPTAAAASLSRLRACSAKLLGPDGAGLAGLFGLGSTTAAAQAAPAAAAPSAEPPCRESAERSGRCAVVTREGVRLLRCTETLRRLRTCAGAPPQEVEVVEETTLRRLGGEGGAGAGRALAAGGTAAEPAAAASAAASDSGLPSAPGGSIVLNPEATEALQAFMGYADFLAATSSSSKARSGGGA